MIQREVFRDLVKISLPLMLGSFLQTVYNLTDTYFLGKLGKEELSAPSIVMPLILFLVMFGMGMAAAGSTLIAQTKGKGDDARSDFYLGQMTLVLLCLAVLIMLSGLLIAKPVLILLHTPESTIQFAYQYMVIVFCGIPLMFGFFILQGSLRGIGNTTTPLLIQTVSVVLNVGLDPVLIFGLWGFPQLGVKGAAIATVFARVVASVISFIILFRGKHGLHLQLSNLLPDKDAVKLLFRIGLPTAIGRSISIFGFVVLQGMVNSFGTAVSAAFGIGNQLINLFNMPSMALSMGTTALIGQSLGAKNHERTHHIIMVSAKSVLAFIIPTMTMMFLWGNLVTRFFVNDPETIYHGAMFFRVVSVSVVFFALFNIVVGTLQGAGDTKPLMFLEISRLWLFRLPLAYLFTAVFLWGTSGLWYSIFLSNIFCFLLGLLWLRRGSWRTAIDVDTI